MLNSKGFDLWADGYDKSVGLSDEDNTYPFAGYKNVLNTIFSEIVSKYRPTVMDIGFGTGTLTKKLYEYGCEIWGLDFSERMIQLAKEKMPGAHLFRGDFSKGVALELRQQSYDYIIATYSLHHLSDGEKVRLIDSLLPLLKENGKIIVGDVMFENRGELEQCRRISGNEWDDDEIYFVYDEIRALFNCKVRFQKVSHCAGILLFET